MLPESSWVEISSQPSSSSLSSIGDEIITTGLRVSQNPILRRRRRNRQQDGPHISSLPRTTATSSQDEYDESDSEEDHIMTSSNEHVPSFSRVAPVVTLQADLGSESDDDDGNATALGRVYDEPGAFTPQPNAFSHPPSAQSQGQNRSAIPGSYFPRTSHPQHNQRHSYPSRAGANSRPQHSPYNTISPGHRTDHDEALRASLTTLLSCAAAARGLPKRSNGQNQAQTSTRPEFTGFRLIPESELPGAASPSPRTQSTRSLSDQEADKGKRKAVTPTAKTASGQSRAAKKKKITPGDDALPLVSPTLLTWVVSAGVVVLVSVVGFGAGYVVGREVGRQEVGVAGGCGQEIVRGTSGELRKFRWGGGRGVTV